MGESLPSNNAGVKHRRRTVSLVERADAGDQPEGRDWPGERGVVQLPAAGGLTRLAARTSTGVVIAELTLPWWGEGRSWEYEDVLDAIAWLEQHLDRIDPMGPRLAP